MKVVKSNDVETKDLSGEPLFTGGMVQAKFLIGTETAKELGLAVIAFDAGAKNVFHTHTTEQILYVTEGKGIVATENEEIVVTPGMAIYFPAGEKHWHGATDESSFTHIAIAPPHKTEF